MMQTLNFTSFPLSLKVHELLHVCLAVQQHWMHGIRQQYRVFARFTISIRKCTLVGKSQPFYNK